MACLTGCGLPLLGQPLGGYPYGLDCNAPPPALILAKAKKDKCFSGCKLRELRTPRAPLPFQPASAIVGGGFAPDDSLVDEVDPDELFWAGELRPFPRVVQAVRHARQLRGY